MSRFETCIGSTYVPTRSSWRSRSGRVGGPSWNRWRYTGSSRNRGRNCRTIWYWWRWKLSLREGWWGGLWNWKVFLFSGIKTRWWRWWSQWNRRTMLSILNFFIDGTSIFQLAIYRGTVLLWSLGDSILLTGLDNGVWDTHNSSLETDRKLIFQHLV